MKKWYNSIFFRCIGITLVFIGMGSCNKLSNESYTTEGYAEKLRHERIMANCEEEVINEN